MRASVFAGGRSQICQKLQVTAVLLRMTQVAKIPRFLADFKSATGLSPCIYSQIFPELSIDFSIIVRVLSYLRSRFVKYSEVPMGAVRRAFYL